MKGVIILLLTLLFSCSNEVKKSKTRVSLSLPTNHQLAATSDELDYDCYAVVIEGASNESACNSTTDS